MDMFPPDTKELAWEVFRDKGVKTSTRLACLFFYGLFKACDVIDWFFPVKVASKKYQ